MKAVKSIYNHAWKKNWGFVPWSDKEFAALASKLKILIIPQMVVIAEVAGSPVGMLISVPDYNYVLKKFNDRLFLFGVFILQKENRQFKTDDYGRYKRI